MTISERARRAGAGWTVALARGLRTSSHHTRGDGTVSGGEKGAAWFGCPKIEQRLESQPGADLEETAAAGAVDARTAADRAGHVAECGAGERILRIGEPRRIGEIQRLGAEIDIDPLVEVEG